MSPRRPTLSWSKTRDGSLVECPRKYFFQYYGYWLGWEPGAPPRTREIYRLRQLRSRHVWVGEVVHSLIEGLLRDLRQGREAPPLAELKQRARQRMRDDYRASRLLARGRREPADGADAVALFEHEYGLRVSDDEWRRVADLVDRCLGSFLDGPAWQRIRGTDPEGQWLELEELRSFDLDGVPVRVKLDFAHLDGDEAVVVDWKTGRSRPDTRLQLGCYVYYLASSRAIEPGRIRALEVNLTSGREREHRFGDDDLDRVRERIRSGIRRMTELLRDVGDNLAEEEDFPPNPSPWRCRNCNFRRVCPAVGGRAWRVTGSVAPPADGRAPGRTGPAVGRPGSVPV